MSKKTFIYQVVYPVSAQTLLAKQKSVKALMESAKPFMRFKEVDNFQSSEFVEGETYTFNAKFLYIFPLGKYNISFIKANDRHFFSISSFKAIKELKHWVDLTYIEENKTMCTHQIEIDAGWLTPIVYFVTRLYHWNKRRKWNKMVSR